MTDICQQCGNEYERIGTHWTRSSECSYPSLTQKEREVATGLLMGDGSISGAGGGKPYLQSKMITPDYLEYVDSLFGVFGNGVTLYLTAEENAEEKRKSGFRPDADPEDYSDIYEWWSMRHSDFQEFAEWYSSGEKVWPADIKLTPTVLKHWYCGDGHWNNSGTKNRIEISMSNERENTDKVDRFFENVGLPSPNNYNVCQRKSGGYRCNAEFTVEQSKELWEYMGEPLPGFEYKWPEEYR